MAKRILTESLAEQGLAPLAEDCNHRENDASRKVQPTLRFGSEVAVFLVRCYQTGISPLLGSSCRFQPTCSQYAIESIRRHGVVGGSWRAFKRILRCHPFNPGGYDPP